MAGSMRQEDVVQPTKDMEPGSEVDIAPPPTKPNVAQSVDEQPLPSPVVLVVDVAAEP